MNNNITFFNEMADNFNKNIPKVNYKVANSIIEKFRIGLKCSVLDVGCGTGILYSILKDRNLSEYVGIDISEKMIEEFLNTYPHVDVRQADFELAIKLENAFDYIIIFNSIPHFIDLSAVFENVYNNLNSGGTFIIAHSKTREGLKEHHRKIGHVSDKEEPIPNDLVLLNYSVKNGFTDNCIINEDYFCFSCKRKIRVSKEI